ncbi:MAG: tRNA (adenosine(37)-N6)-dimethylallyltransferase MiaA [Candidatus Paceibacterota bacterium]
MKISQPQKIIIVLGPTASGKSDLAVKIALYIKKQKNLGLFNTAIISADSRQVYKGFNIGSGKITSQEMRGIPHYALDIASPQRRFTVSQYQQYVKKILKKLIKQKTFPILCGGTGLYIDSVLYNYILPHVKPNLVLRMQLEKLTTEKLFLMLTKKDSVRAQTIDRHNRRRLIRALEILHEQKTIPPLEKTATFNALIIGINPTQSTLYKRIHVRLLKRLRGGMITEVKQLHAKGLSYARLESFGLEYRYIAQFLQKKLSKKEMEELLEKEIQHYTKRQMTWFKKNKDITWIEKPDLTKTLQNNILTFLRM